MHKLLEAFKKNPTKTNLKRIRKYLGQHPMSSCFISPEELRAIQQNYKTDGVTK